MTEATRHAPGTPCWVSLMVHDPDATTDFYGALFGWEFHPGPQQLGPYVRALLDGKEVAGIGRLPADQRLPVAWTPYLAAPDVNRTAEELRSCGGTVGVGPLDAEDAGRLAIVTDTAGAVFGLWQAAGHLGIAAHGTHGTPVWNELVTADTSVVVKFYRTVFGYEEQRDPAADTDRTTLIADGRPVAAVRGVGRALPRDRGSHWLTWFEVDDVDAAVGRVVELGGRVVEAAADGDRGRAATVADPEGAVFTVVRTAG
ncbi:MULTISPECIES: VOC family protein [Streptomyces]|uniref:VOC family protein n=1 Tax=Streptomyces tsukubensis (strain DSM 42081 / NBRC 108919 / NRRL 18488 / 9993) TaxID=1114943 RepID=A0A7G3U9H2_STRT9|nr:MULTISPECIES: VOC family protein [Streptomyces]AZK96932.1 glyoxalase/bleomycin resistance/extradiol dioxygenase family protein [Streptomyces tsukubensis]MYS66598.1 VOC family protein [Streptomyces sp. SID5473]QKM67084.1 VOC family protein [Streptomyces tsukubensis NRRL18488]TAI41435.1 VOC family protein [Streptomyces tsukubensis]